MPTVTQEKIRKILSSKKGFTYLLLILIIAGTIKTAVYTVDATEQSVVTRFGKYIKTVSPGLHIKLPFGIDRAHNIPVEVAQTEQFGFSTLRAGRNNEYKNNIMSEQTMLTGDLNIVNVEWIIQYRIADPKAWLFNVQEKKQTIRDISRSVINTLVGDRAILDIMSAERTNIEHQSKDMM
ncbi:MAG: HflK protein, partial [Treponema sp.]|nr:HflK protein [Treponema sp.]